MTRTQLHFAGRLALVLPLLLVLSCSKQPTDATNHVGETPLLMQANVAATTINTLVVDVTASDIATPLVYNLLVVDGVASGTIVIPVGSDRIITVKAFDSSGIETHRGIKTVDITEGMNATADIMLEPLTGDVPVVVTFGSLLVIVDPDQATIAVGETVQLTATVLDAHGDPITEPAAWAASNPAVATVDASGLVTGLIAGSAVIVATYDGVGAAAAITVQEGSQGSASASHISIKP